MPLGGTKFSTHDLATSMHNSSRISAWYVPHHTCQHHIGTSTDAHAPATYCWLGVGRHPPVLCSALRLFCVVQAKSSVSQTQACAAQAAAAAISSAAGQAASQAIASAYGGSGCGSGGSSNVASASATATSISSGR